MSLTNENYFSPENSMKYMGVSQFKSFQKCPAAALAEVKGEYKQEKTSALLIGSFVDSSFSNELDLFKAQNAGIFLKNGGLKAEYRQAEYIIQRIERDPLFMKYIGGQPQVIMTGEVEGVPVKIKIDSYHPGKAIVDLKVMKDMADIWQDGTKKPWWEAWGYHLQAGLYQAIEGNSLPFYLVCATKEAETDIGIFKFAQSTLDYAMLTIRANIKRFDDIKKGLIEPEKCNQCNYCKFNKVLSVIEEL